MTSRRPMTRSFSGNGRQSSFGEEEGGSHNGRPETRNTYLSNVRPETSYSRYSHYRPPRSTLCSVMAQLTDDVQPSFETTLKSKAVSENCNVKFTCVVSGYPTPELKWYKDDMQMDRYCGLPKYEIRRNGKTHTLHIYNCTLDDAAIYQVSASNSKGIVSCSGVLEVGTMSEYQIHQRFFAKLKQKAEKKKSDLEAQSTKEDKENIQKEKRQTSPERPPRKRQIPTLESKKPDDVEQLGAAAEANGVTSEVKETAPVTAKGSDQENKKIKISNGVDAGINSNSSKSHMMGNGGENCYDGGISLAQFLAEALQSQATEEKQNSPYGEKPKEMDIADVSVNIEQNRERERMQKEREVEKALQEEHEKEKRKEEEMAREKERVRPFEMSHTVPYSKPSSGAKHHSKAHKDHDHHIIQTSISSMLHSVKDFLFGKSKKDPHDHIEKRDRESDHLSASAQPPKPETPPSFRLQLEQKKVSKPLAEDVVPMDIDKPKESTETLGIEKPSVSLEPHEHKQEVSDLHLPPKPESVNESTGQRVREAAAVEVMESSMPESKGPEEETSLSPLQGLTEAEENLSQSVSLFKDVPVEQQEPHHLAVSHEPYHQTARDECSTTNISVSDTQTAFERECPPTLSSLEESWTPSSISTTDSHSLEVGPTKTLPEEDMSVDERDKEGEPDMGLTLTKLCEEEKTEVKSIKQPFSDINRPEMTELIPDSLEERMEPCECKTPDHLLSSLSFLAADSVEGDNMKGEAEQASLIQEMHVGFPLTVAESLEESDLKMQQECTSSISIESTEAHKLSEIQSSNSGCRSSEKGLELKEVLSPALEKDLESKLRGILQTNEQAILEGESTEARKDNLPFEVETEKRNVIEKLGQLKSLSETLSKEFNVHVEEQTNVAHEESSERQQGCPSVNIPQIQISMIEDTLHIEPDVNQNEHFIIPTIEIKEPEVKENTLPPAILVPDMQELDLLQNHDATHVSEARSQSVADSSCLLPTHQSMQSDSNPSLTEKVQDVAQLVDKTEIFEQDQSPVEQLPQVEFASIPVINVSCSDDKEKEMDVDVNTHMSDSQQPYETPTVPLFVVPPISVTCHESDHTFRLPSQGELFETVTSAATQRETKPDVDNNTTTKSEKTQSTKQTHPEETRDQGINENTPSLLYEAQIPKVGDNVPTVSKITEGNIVPDILKTKLLKDTKVENLVTVDEVQRNRLCSKPPTHPSLSPSSLRKFMSRAATDSDNDAVTSVSPNEKADEDLSGGSTPTSSLSCESSPRLKRRDSLSLIRSATPEELASGARRKIYILKPKEDAEGALEAQVKKENPYMSPSQARRAALLQAPTGQKTPPMERRSPLLSRRKITLEVPKLVEEPPKEEPAATKQEEKSEKKLDPLKAPQVIRKIRGEPFPDASGHLKLWCQFFNVLSDSTIKWYRDEEEILEVKRSGGDETQVALAIVLASNEDCGVYGCSISNEYGTDNTDFLLSEDVLSDILLKDDLEVGEEIEMTPMLFAKGLADSGSWGEKYFGRIMTETVRVGEGYAHKASRVKVIYGLDPIFESGSTCIIKVQNPIAYGTKQESNLTERNLDITKKECKVQNMIREYCKIFATEARVTENFGSSLEVIPQFLMYRPANTVPYATVEADLDGVFVQYCTMDPKGKLITRSSSEVEQKCSTFQHWIHQWTHGNLLVTRLEGVDTKITNVKVVTKSKGYQGLTVCGSPEVFEQFLTHHQCNYYCGLLGLHPLKSMDSQPSKMKRSPLLNRKLGSSSPQTQRKGQSPQMLRKSNCSPKVNKKVKETSDNKSDTKDEPAQTVEVLETR